MDIICCAFPAWEGNYVKSTVELMRATAAQGHRVLYVDYAWTWTDFFKSFFGKKAAPWRRMLGIEPRLRTVADGLFVLTLPPVAPTNFLKNARLHDAINRANTFFLEKTIKKASKKLGFQSPTVVNAFNPRFGLPLAGRLGEGRLVYYCYDEIGAANWAGRHGTRLESSFLKKCDAAVVSSDGLFSKMKNRHGRVFLVKNGVDFELFKKAGPSVFSEKKTVGYLGSIDDRLDFELLERLFKKFENVRFVFVGRVQNEAVRARLAAFPNVDLRGPRQPEELPAAVSEMDVCLIPFVKNAFTAAIYPMKINEYLAAGKAVVATDFAPLDEFSEIVDIAHSPDIFEKAVEKALFQPNPAAVFARKSFAEKNSWAERARQFTAICDQKQG